MKRLILVLLLITSSYSKDCMNLNIISPNSAELTFVDMGIEYNQVLKRDNIKKLTLKPYRETYDREIIKLESPYMRCGLVDKKDINTFIEWFNKGR